jgi:hypothetical protein
MSTTYFHVSPVPLTPGFIVHAGNHGLVINTYRHFTADAVNGWRLATELVLENFRLQHAADKPSRFESAFAFLSEADARARASAFAVASRVYEVEFVHPADPHHVGSFDLYAALVKSEPNRAFLPKAQELSRDYWTGVPHGIREIMTTSDLRVLRPV